MKNERKQDQSYNMRRGNPQSASSGSEKSVWDEKIAESMDYYENRSDPEIVEYMQKVKPITRKDWFE